MSNKPYDVLGLDLGTTTCCLYTANARGEAELVVNCAGENTTLSVVCFKKGESGKYTCTYGSSASREISGPNVFVISNVKRFIGRNYNEVPQDVINMLPYKLAPDSDGRACIDIDGDLKRPEYISSLLIRKLVEDYYSGRGKPVPEKAKIVITVPAYFDFSQKEATKVAAQLAGLEATLIAEPTAAAVAYSLDKELASSGKEKCIVIFDFGGGTFDISILKISDADGTTFLEAVVTKGDSMLGGSDFDNAIMMYTINEFLKKEKIDLSTNIEAKAVLLAQCKKTKEQLSFSESATIAIPYICTGPEGPKHIKQQISRDLFESLVMKMVERSVNITEEAIEESIKEQYISGRDAIHKVVLVGGSTRVPLVQRLLERKFKCVAKDINPDEVVAKGAAIKFCIDEQIGSASSIILMDNVAIPIGIETLGGTYTKIIERGQKIPCSHKEVFSTTADFQTEADLHLLQGDRPLAKYNKSIGTFRMTGISRKPRGQAQIEVEVKVKVDGTVEVTARDPSAPEAKIYQDGQEVTGAIKIDISKHGMTKEQVTAMMKEAEEQRENDAKEVRLIQIRNEMDIIEYEVGQKVKQIKDKGSEHDSFVADINKRMEELSEEKNGQKTADELSPTKDKYMKIQEEVDQYLSKIQQPAPADSGSENPNEPSSDNPSEAPQGDQPASAA